MPTFALAKIGMMATLDALGVQLLADEDEDRLRLRESMYPVEDSYHVTGVVAIPVCAVKRRERITSSF